MVLKGLVYSYFHVGVSGGLVRTDLDFFTLEGKVVLKGLIFVSFFLGRVSWS